MKPCARCGKPFRPKFNRSTYCSDKCRLGEATCLKCGEVFVVKKGSGGKYCSPKCWYSVDRSKPCPICGNPYKTRQKTCSVACGKELVRRNHPTRQANCARCGGPIIGKRPQIRYCSYSCANRDRAYGPHHGSALPIGTRRPINGYVRIKVSEDRWVLEHRLVVENQIGRPLERHERVHHRNGRRHDNRPENLELWKVKGKKDPPGVRSSDYHCPGCRCN